MKPFLIGLIGMVMGCGALAAAAVTDHGVAVPVSKLGGVVSTANKAGQDLVVAFLGDASGGSGALVVNIDTRTSHFVPFPGHKWNIDACAFTSLLSRANRYYTAFGDRFYEFDPETMTFTFAADIDGFLGMGMCEDANGVVYVNSYPKGNITAFDPKTRTIRECGAPKEVNYWVYCRYMAYDDDGWIYCGNGSTEAEIQAFNPATGEFRQLFPVGDDPVIREATCEVRRRADGKVVGRVRGGKPFIRVLENGRMTPGVNGDWPPAEIPYPQAAVTGSQWLVYRDLPSGRTLQKLNLQDRKIIVKEKDGSITEFAIDYPSAGSYLAAVIAMPDGTIRGASSHPMRYFVYDIAQKRFTGEGDAARQWNALYQHGDHLLIGGYGHGLLIDWDTTKPFEQVSPHVNHNGNPRTLGEGQNDLHRPACIQVMPGGRQIVMTGSPGYGRTGGGLVIYDVETKAFDKIPKEVVLGDFSGAGLVPLSETEILIGTSCMAGTGGRDAAGNAGLVIFDTVKRKVIWRDEPFENVRTYHQLLRLPDGRIMGMADMERIFIWDPATRKVEKVVSEGKSLPFQQGPRLLLCDGKRVIVLFARSVEEYDMQSGSFRVIADCPRGISSGGDLAGGRVWFASHARLMSVPY